MENRSYAFLINKGKILVFQDLTMKALKITLHDGKVLILGNTIYIIENAAIPNEQNKLTTNLFLQQYPFSISLS
jgi:hypothetical protein